jgi:hypothetical protein
MRGAGLAAGLVLTTAGFLIAAAGASAAKPHGGAHYLGFEGSETQDIVTQSGADLYVSASGSKFTGMSYVRIGAECGRGRYLWLGGTRIHGGRFAKTEREGPFRTRLRGHFVARGYATFRYSATRTSRGCESRVRTGVLYENGEPPFSGCSSQPAKTVVQNGDGRILEQLRVGGGGVARVDFGCLFSVNKRVPLGGAATGEQHTGPRLVAPYAAFVEETSGHPSVRVRDLRDGRLVSDLALTMSEHFGEPRVTDLELKPNGSVAWLVRLPYTFGPPSNSVEVIAVDANGRRLLDSSDDVVPDSLTLDGSTLSWINAGVTHSATLD